MTRIITHGGCTDGFSSAFIYLKYFQKNNQNIEIIQLQPKDVQLGEFQFTEDDVVLDLPQPKTKIKFWCDHHRSNKPEGELPENYFWKITPSCAGFLIDLAIEGGLKASADLLEFKRIIDIMDNAEYTREMIKECFYRKESYENPSALLQLHMLAAMFHSKDKALNEEIFRSLLAVEAEETPLQTSAILKLNPLMFHKAYLENLAQWREVLDSYVEYNEKARCVVQDDRKVQRTKGVPDRYYIYMKFPQAKYGINVRITEDNEARVGIGCNIFHKEWCTVDIGNLCSEVGKKFGAGSGGGHFTVGGATIFVNKIDEVLAFIIEKLTFSSKVDR